MKIYQITDNEKLLTMEVNRVRIRDDIKAWMMNNCTAKWRFSHLGASWNANSFYIKFKSNQDYSLFVLTWT